jgi:hypothetical protein
MTIYTKLFTPSCWGSLRGRLITQLGDINGHTSPKWPLALSLLLGVLLICLLLFSGYTLFFKPYPTFLTTTSPRNSYTVSLKGQETQPFFFTVEVRYDVFKKGVRLLSNKFLSSGDGMDFPFEFKYPNHRWINEQCLQLYRKEDLEERAPDTLVVVNDTSQTIRYARIEGVDIVLIFEMQPGFKVRLPTAQSRVDTKWMDVKGEFSDGSAIKEFSADIGVKDASGPKTFCVDLWADKTTVERQD